MIRWAPTPYIQDGLAQGHSREYLQECLKQAHVLQDNYLPPILTLGHLAFHTEVPFWKLRTYVARKLVITDGDIEPKAYKEYDPYRTFKITKKGSGFRRICVPEPDLMRLQKWIDKFILSELSVSPHSYAFDGKSIEKCANQHLRCKWLIKIDLRNFFESLSEKQAYNIFLTAGYQPLVAFELARICTKVRTGSYVPIRWRNNSRRMINAYNHDVIGHLPQGAPTSPKLSNLIVRQMDNQIAELAYDYGLTYTRYADDMAFSTDKSDFSRGQSKEFIRRIYKILPKHGLTPNPQKVQIIPPRARKIVLGLLVDTGKVRLSKEFRSSLECHWFFCAKDPVFHARQRGFNSLFGLKNFVKGKISYARQIDSEYVDKIERKFGAITWPI